MVLQIKTFLFSIIVRQDVLSFSVCMVASPVLVLIVKYRGTDRCSTTRGGLGIVCRISVPIYIVSTILLSDRRLAGLRMSTILVIHQSRLHSEEHRPEYQSLQQSHP